jgi:hypothetical protein
VVLGKNADGLQNGERREQIQGFGTKIGSAKKFGENPKTE